MVIPPEEIRIVWQNFSPSPLGRVAKAAFITNSRGISRPRLLRSFALVYLTQGQGQYEDAGGISRPVERGDLIFLFPDIAHRYGPGPEQNWSEFYILFDGPVFEQWRASGLLDPAKPIHRIEPVSYWIKRLQNVVEPSTGAAGQLYPLSSVCRLQQTLADVFIALDEGRIGAEDRRWLERAYALVESPAHDEQLDWHKIASQLHMSYENFRKRFTRLAGMPPSKYRMRRVMEQAAQYLLESRLTVKEVADRCGFCNEFHFSRRFKQVVGLSPRDFRRQLPH